MFVETRCRSNFSFLTGASDAREYVKQAHTFEMPAIAITDRNGIYAIPRAFEATQEFPVKLLVGAELSFLDHPAITLIAPHKKAYGDLCKLITLIHAKEQKLPFLDFLEKLASSELIALPDFQNDTDLNNLKDCFQDRLYLPWCRALDGLDALRDKSILKASHFYNIPAVATG